MANEDEDVQRPDLTSGVALSRLTEGEPFLGTVDDDPVVVVKQKDQLFAIGAQCTHYGGPLEKGLVVGDTIRCPWHHAVFDLKTGDAIGAPAFRSAGCYPIEIDGFHFRVLPKIDAEEDSAKPRADDEPESVVIIGAGAAAAAAAEKLRQQGYQHSITMIGTESSGPVDRPNLSKDYMAGNAKKEWIPLGGDAHWKKMGVTLVKGASVTEIDRSKQLVKTDHDQSFSYDKLLYATGAEPIVPPIGGLESTRYFTLRSFEDSQAIVKAAENATSVLVVGASFIGLEVAASLRGRGVEVTVAAPESLPLARIFGDDVGRLIKSVHEEKGVKFHLGAKVEHFDGGTAKLSDNSEISFDFVVLAVGVKPRTEVAEAAGLEVHDGVLVDAELKTNDELIYAAGDVARYPDFRSGQPRRIEHWVVAQRQAQTAAQNMITESAEKFTDVPFFWSRHFGLTIHYIGYAPKFDEVIIDGDLDERKAVIGYLKDGEILAIAAIRRPIDSLCAEWALAEGDQERLRELIGK